VALVTPARLRALLVLAGVGGFLFAATMTSFFEYSDEDSVAALSPERACLLARAAANSSAPCSAPKPLGERAMEVEVGGSARPRRACFLRAARWFVVEVRPFELSCPTQPPRRNAVTSFKEELRVESTWSEQVRTEGAQLAYANLRDAVSQLVATWRTTESPPTQCPKLLPGEEVQALDVDLVRRTEKPWHFLSSDAAERLLDAPPSPWVVEAEMAALRKRSPLLLLVYAKEKQEPSREVPGFVEGEVALVDWPARKLLCTARFSYDQPADAPRDPESPHAPLMTDFKTQLNALLGERVRVMTDEQLQLAPTW
jgi:hypothetical protein